MADQVGIADLTVKIHKNPFAESFGSGPPGLGDFHHLPHRILASEHFKNSLTAIPGIHLGQLTLAEDDVQTGVTLILPYPLEIRNRKLFLGSFASGNWNEWTGLHVAQDFGTFSSPIVLCNATTVGIAYDALISFGHQRDADLPIDNAWPPIVIGIDDGYLNDLRQRRITHDQILQTIKIANDSAPACGSVGIGRGLCAFGGKGGAGDAARFVQIGEQRFTLGAFIAANGGRLPDQNEAESPRSVAPGFVMVLATDAPLLPEQLRRLAEAGVRSLDRVGINAEEDQRLALAFSTTNTIDNAFEEQYQLFNERWLGQETLAKLCEAAVNATLQALRKAVQQTEAVSGRKGRIVPPIASNLINWKILLQEG